jgi:hypothetical protein
MLFSMRPWLGERYQPSQRSSRWNPLLEIPDGSEPERVRLANFPRMTWIVSPAYMNHDARPTVGCPTDHPVSRRSRLRSDRSRCRAISGPQGHAAASHGGLDLGHSHDFGRGYLALHPYDPNLGTVEPHSPSVVVHAGGGSAGRLECPTAQCPCSSFSDDLDLQLGACRHRLVHAGARTDHEQGVVRRLRLTPSVGEAVDEAPQTSLRRGPRSPS